MSADPRDGVRDAVGTMSHVRDPIATGLVLGAAADLLLADPRRGHPVAGFGALAGRLERRIWRDDRATGLAYAGGLGVPAAGPGRARGAPPRPGAPTAPPPSGPGRPPSPPGPSSAGRRWAGRPRRCSAPWPTA